MVHFRYPYVFLRADFLFTAVWCAACSAVTVSIFGFVVAFGHFFNKNRGSGSVSVFL